MTFLRDAVEDTSFKDIEFHDATPFVGSLTPISKASGFFTQATGAGGVAALGNIFLSGGKATISSLVDVGRAILPFVGVEPVDPDISIEGPIGQFFGFGTGPASTRELSV